ncbi:MAG: 4-hydroxy-tetrahydrodipicolinate synthase [Christensenellales bacterium]|jgi:4-hydroxy-tetrahydrodipicolinate synthase|nr:4-hydroxy-tetrahydrodipicolinate synthase [Clostridia bacterium]HRU84316.1 4-hydroxy-tetrahydrodipicolinate synthase [Eubacteriales bacterium]
MALFKGCGTALITPFTEDGVDFDAFERLIRFQISEGIDALVALGTTGEPATMTDEEKEAVIKFVVKKVKGRVPVIIGTGSNSTAHAIEQTKRAEALGADAVLAVTPYYNKATQGGLIAHYKAIAESTSLPIIVYNVPGRTGVNLLPATFGKLAEIENIAGIKEACGNIEQISDCCRLCEGKADVYSGDDGIVVPVMSVGGIGVISVVSNVLPRYMSEMTAAWLSGDIKKARDMQLKVLPLVKAIFSEVNPIPIKKAAEIIGLCSGILRLPLTEMQPENTEVLKKILAEF